MANGFGAMNAKNDILSAQEKIGGMGKDATSTPEKAKELQTAVEGLLNAAGYIRTYFREDAGNLADGDKKYLEATSKYAPDVKRMASAVGIPEGKALEVFKNPPMDAAGAQLIAKRLVDAARETPTNAPPAIDLGKFRSNKQAEAPTPSAPKM